MHKVHFLFCSWDVRFTFILSLIKSYIQHVRVVWRSDVTWDIKHLLCNSHPYDKVTFSRVTWEPWGHTQTHPSVHSFYASFYKCSVGSSFEPLIRCKNLPNKMKRAVKFNYVSSVRTTCCCFYSYPAWVLISHRPIRAPLSPSSGDSSTLIVQLT